MLDFYLIKDDQPKPSYPELIDLEFIIGLDLVTFKSLIKKQLIDSRFDYYSDFRWDESLIKQIELKISRIQKFDSATKKLEQIIKKAIDKNCDIITYCD
ncbi:hypothetical protein [Aquimarina algiphila]|uniref:hypothetical protein n=1 Tax=Aquimarina algiphila TaxID=2047982 RepID=UPI00232DD93C|nr:hypothetical protein [Aquimarina algiphila]